MKRRFYHFAKHLLNRCCVEVKIYCYIYNMMLYSSLVHLLISSYLLLAVGANEIEISETCPPTRDFDNFFYRRISSSSKFELPRPWTVNSTLTVVVQRTDESAGLVVNLDSEESSRLTLTVKTTTPYEDFEHVRIIIEKSRREGLWRSRFYTFNKPNELLTLNVIRGNQSYQVEVNGKPILLTATRREAHEDPSLLVGPLDVHNRITVNTSYSHIKNVCFWNTTNILPGHISDSKSYDVKNSPYCTVRDERTFPDKMYKRYIGRSLTENTVLTFVGKWSSEEDIDIKLSSNTSLSSFRLLYIFGENKGEVYMTSSSGYPTYKPFKFQGEVPANELFSFNIERLRTSYEITINGLKFNVSQPEYQIDPDIVHDQFRILDGGRTLKNICVYEKEMQEKDLPQPLETIPFAVAVPLTCRVNNTCVYCVWFSGQNIMPVLRKCRDVPNEKPYLFEVKEECRLIEPPSPKPKKVNFEVCYNATILRSSV